MATNEISPADAQSTRLGSATEPSLRGLPTLARWYINTREWEANGLDLPLLDILRPAEQQAVKRFHHASDRRMSLASHLLKYLYIHHACGVAWRDIVFSRTPMPENRPYYASSTQTQVDFNVSHQASLTILAGVIAPSHEQLTRQAVRGVAPSPPRIGIDITCVNERRKPMKTMKDFTEFVSIFSEVFSAKEMATMQNPLSTLRRARELGLAASFPSDDVTTLIEFGLRLFYSYWALKEAYLKMTGDALLAEWVRHLEFTNVIPPALVDPLIACKPYGLSSRAEHVPQSPLNWGPPYTEVEVSRDGEVIEGVRLQLQAFESDYIIATAGRGCPVGSIPEDCENAGDHHSPSQHGASSSGGLIQEKRIPISAHLAVGQSDPWSLDSDIVDPWLPMQEVDIELDIRACAEGRCSH
ncbi:4'-phosphopantetheinyl transferase A [Penicillium cataractarum]|uniref:holo-[acyl-carrier-protein] synthase n=1 Tax=Penicillium cataractarum TaxID=2100454 RepID=A0A9W9RZ21_9EURO|nr:4'-phosphopantetheinyl transferase A [Penicillium cataractarum]KAJ5369007.1 4'-phosphopantetheinyl transferase A [Penicillium cataractarum]